MAARLVRHFIGHLRFYGAIALGIAAWLVSFGHGASVRFLLAGDAFFAAHLVAMALLVKDSRIMTFRRRASQNDEGLGVIALITIAIVMLSLGSVFALINQHEKPSLLMYALSVASLPLGWCTLHTVFAFHYAHVYYADQEPPAGYDGGLEFPGGKQPQAWDFLYYAFVVGMTAQVADVNVLSTRMRRLTLFHGAIAFFFNTVILAVAVNASVTLAP